MQLDIPAALIRAAIWALGRLPLRLRQALGAALGHLFSLLPIRDRIITELQLKLAFPEAKDRPSPAAVYAHLGSTVMESLNLAPLLDENTGRHRCPSFEQYRDVLTQRERPILGLTAHTGNWDFSAAWFIRQGLPVTTVAREANNPSLQAPLIALREAYGIKIIWRDDKRAIKDLMRCFEAKGVICPLVDQDTKVKSSSSLFFGRPAQTPNTLIELGLRYKARFFTCFNAREQDGFLIGLEAIPDGLSTQDILDEYNKRLEAWIRRFPEQWVWVHRRWRTGTDGKRKSSREYTQWLRSQIGE